MSDEHDQQLAEDFAQQAADDAALDARQLAQEEAIARGETLEDAAEDIEAVVKVAWDEAYRAELARRGSLSD